MPDDEIARAGGTTATPWHPPVPPIDGGAGGPTPPPIPTCSRDFSNSPDGVPSGRVTLDDSQLGREGVRRILVICIGLFYIEADETDDCGYYEMRKDISFDIWYLLGTAHVVPSVWYNTQFENDRARFRTTHIGTAILGQYEMTTTHSIGIWAAPHNGRDFNYNPGNDLHDEATRFWATAQANNALHDFYDFADDSDVGIAPPPKQLEVLLVDFLMEGAGVAPMIARNYATGGHLPAVNAGIIVGLCGTAVVSSAIPVVGPGLSTVSAAAAIIATKVALCPPDVIIGYDLQGPGGSCGNNKWRQSDEFKGLCYHEYAHAGHYTKVGNTYWEYNMQYTITYGKKNTDGSVNDALTYGAGNRDGHERCEIIEAWATLIGYYFTDKKYSTHFYNYCVTNTKDYKQRLERLYLGWDIIPQGLFYDLLDAPTETETNNGPNLPTGTDNISDINIPSIYSKLDAHTHGFKYLRDRLVELKPNKAAEIDQLLRDGYHRNY
jgi:hypothetical protein